MAGRGPLPQGYGRSFGGPEPPFGPMFGPPPPMGPPHPMDMLPPEVLEHRLAIQTADMQKLANENQRLHDSLPLLRQDLAVARQEVERLKGHLEAFVPDKEQQIRNILDKNAKMEMEVVAHEALKADHQNALSDNQRLFAIRKDLASQVQELTQEIQRAHVDIQQYAGMHAEIDAMRQELQRARNAFEYHKQICGEQAEQNQVMEKNFLSLVRESENLQAQIASSRDRRGPDLPYDAKYESHDSAYPAAGPSMYGDGYGVSQMSGGAENAHPYPPRSGPENTQYYPVRAGGPENAHPYPVRASAPENPHAYPPRASGPENPQAYPPRASGPENPQAYPPRVGGPENIGPYPARGGPENAISYPPRGGPESAIPFPPRGGSESAVPFPTRGGSETAVPSYPARGGSGWSGYDAPVGGGSGHIRR